MGQAAELEGKAASSGNRLSTKGLAHRLLGFVAKTGCIVALSPLLIVAAMAQIGLGLLLCVAIWFSWGRRNVLLVYSDSPVWKPHFDTEVLPRLEGRAVVLNWSERRRWQETQLPVCAFRYFAAGPQCNPVAIVFRPLRAPRTFRYWKAFKDFKHGNPRAVRDLDRRLFEVLGV